MGSKETNGRLQGGKEKLEKFIREGLDTNRPKGENKVSYTVDGCYNNKSGYWESVELFARKGEVRLIDGELHYLAWSCLFFTRVWYPLRQIELVSNNCKFQIEGIYKFIEDSCVLKKKNKKEK